MPSPPYLEFEGIEKAFPGVRALQGVSFGIPEGTVCGLLGENGAGKSTLMKILGGQYPADAGTLRIAGEPRQFASAADSISAGIAIIHQELQLVPEMTVAENLMIGHYPQRGGVIDWKRLFRDAQAHLGRSGIDIDARARVDRLSIGQRQMVEIAKALMLDAKIIALDEPTSSLSQREAEILFGLVRDLRRQGKVLIYISHRLEEVFALCDSAVVLRDGRLVAAHPDLAKVSRGEIVTEMVGREIQDIFHYQPRPLGGTCMDVSGVVGPGLSAPIDFTVKRGEILGFFGLVGAGRSELMRLVCGATRRIGGEVKVAGRLLPPNSVSAAIRHGLAMCSEDRKQDGVLTGRPVDENINISARRTFSRFGFLLDLAREAETADRYIGLLRIRTPSRKQNIVNLSGGNQQKAILSRWLAEPQLAALIIDEPTRGIDVGAKSEIYSILYDLAARGTALVVVSSELPEVMGITDRILVMRQGRISAEFPRGAASERDILGAALPIGE